MSSRGYGGGHSQGSSSGGYDRTRVRNRKDVPLPPHFKCRICERIKSNGLFSKKEHLVYQSRVFSGGPIGPLNYRLCCRGCAGSPSMEMFCKGQCSMYKCLDDFSKTQRLNPETALCLDCMDWKLATEPGLPVIAAPGETVPEAHVTEPIKDNVRDNVRNDVRGNDDESDDEESAVVPSFPAKEEKTKKTLTSLPSTSAEAAMMVQQSGIKEGELIDVSVPGESATSETGEDTVATSTQGSIPASSGPAWVPGVHPFPRAAPPVGPGGHVLNRHQWVKNTQKPPVPVAKPSMVLPKQAYFPPAEDSDDE